MLVSIAHYRYCCKRLKFSIKFLKTSLGGRGAIVWENNCQTFLVKKVFVSIFIFIWFTNNESSSLSFSNNCFCLFFVRVWFFTSLKDRFYSTFEPALLDQKERERKEKSTEILNINFKLEISFIWTNDPLKRIGNHSNSISECAYVRSCCKLGAAQLIINSLPSPLLSTSMTHSSNIYSKTFFIMGGKLIELEGPNS